jgi:predicted DNA-binding transcriptional regulator AlpA
MECASAVQTKRAGRTLSEITDQADELFFPAPLVASRYHVSDMTLYRWVRDPRMQFPAPHYFGRFRYWKLSDLVSWERQRAMVRSA